MRERKVYAGAAAQFDERRNTSRVFGVPRGAGLQLLDELGKHRDADWYRWIVARQNGDHLHDSRRDDGTIAACPVPGCLEVQP